MAFNINEFKSYIGANGGLLKNNRFAVLVTPPAVLGGTGFTDARALQFYAETASVPGIALQSAELRRQGIGNLEKAPWGAAFTDFNVSFRIDQKTKVWNFFQTWMNKIYDFEVATAGAPRKDGSPETYFELEYKDRYVTDMSVFVYNESGKLLITIDFVDAFPVSISDMQLNWGAADIMKLNVTFNFLSWRLRGGDADYGLNMDESLIKNLTNVDLKKAVSTSKAVPNKSNATNSQQ